MFLCIHILCTKTLSTITIRQKKKKYKTPNKTAVIMTENGFCFLFFCPNKAHRNNSDENLTIISLRKKKYNNFCVQISVICRTNRLMVVIISFFNEAKKMRFVGSNGIPVSKFDGTSNLNEIARRTPMKF